MSRKENRTKRELNCTDIVRFLMMKFGKRTFLTGKCAEITKCERVEEIYYRGNITSPGKSPP